MCVTVKTCKVCGIRTYLSGEPSIKHKTTTPNQRLQLASACPMQIDGTCQLHVGPNNDNSWQMREFWLPVLHTSCRFNDQVTAVTDRYGVVCNNVIHLCNISRCMEQLSYESFQSESSVSVRSFSLPFSLLLHDSTFAYLH